MKDCNKCKCEQANKEYIAGMRKYMREDLMTIRRMAEFISKMDIDEDICKRHHQPVTDCNAGGFDCMECIIAHFRGLEK